MYNYYRAVVFERYAPRSTQVFGHAPCFDRGGSANAPVPVGAHGRAARRHHCAAVRGAGRNAPAPATDDHPFPYCADPSIPPSTS